MRLVLELNNELARNAAAILAVANEDVLSALVSCTLTPPTTIVPGFGTPVNVNDCDSPTSAPREDAMRLIAAAFAIALPEALFEGDSVSSDA